MNKSNFKQLNPVLWEIPQDTKPGMRIPARVYASELMLEQAMRDKSFEQLMNVTTLPGMLNHALVMPDVHEGYGFPIGAVAAADFDEGVISPGGIGYDINCGIRLLKTQFELNDIKNNLYEIAREIYKSVPSGMGKGGGLKLSPKQVDEVLNNGCRWAVREGYAESSDLEYIESNGSMTSADSSCVSQHAKERGNDQLGTMGAGNHFVEIDIIKQIFDEEAANAFGLRKGQIVIQIHTGSRGLGHQVATDYVKLMLQNMQKFDFNLPDKELSCAPISSDEGKKYFGAMSAAANYAWTNRQMITYNIRKAWYNIFGNSGGNLQILYDVAHNIAKIEEHIINGSLKKVLIHRKGSTRAFPKNNSEVPEEFRSVGQPVLIPGSMGTSSYVLVGKQEAMEESFGSTCHGSGRTMSRTAALKKIQGRELYNELQGIGIVIQTASMKGLAEEAPAAYKDVESVVEVVELGNIAKRVAKLVPLAVIKG